MFWVPEGVRGTHTASYWAEPDVNFDPMSSSRPKAARVTYVTVALGVRLPRQRELCCSCRRAAEY
ncbi:hypothetical protein Ntsu_02850 [Nocardia sp. IFM 10818]